MPLMPSQREQEPELPRRKFEDRDFRFQQSLLIHGGTWEDQYLIPRRPWSPGTEEFCESVRMDLEREDLRAERKIR